MEKSGWQRALANYYGYPLLSAVIAVIVAVALIVEGAPWFSFVIPGFIVALGISWVKSRRNDQICSSCKKPVSYRRVITITSHCKHCKRDFEVTREEVDL